MRSCSFCLAHPLPCLLPWYRRAGTSYSSATVAAWVEWGRLYFAKVGRDFGRYVERVALADTYTSCVCWCVRCGLGYPRTWNRAVCVGPVISELQVSVAANRGQCEGAWLASEDRIKDAEVRPKSERGSAEEGRERYVSVREKDKGGVESALCELSLGPSGAGRRCEPGAQQCN